MHSSLCICSTLNLPCEPPVFGAVHLLLFLSHSSLSCPGSLQSYCPLCPPAFRETSCSPPFLFALQAGASLVCFSFSIMTSCKGRLRRFGMECSGETTVSLVFAGLDCDLSDTCLQPRVVSLCCGHQDHCPVTSWVVNQCLWLFGSAAVPLLCFPKSNISASGKSSLQGPSAVGKHFVEAASQELLAVLY